MAITTHTAMLQGLKAIPIAVEIDSSPGLPAFVCIGLPSQAVAEAKERITTALTSNGVKLKAQRTIVNLAPADVRKTGSAFELAIAAGLLQLYGIFPQFSQKTMLFGELSLDGSIKPVRGILPLVIAAQQLGVAEVLIPEANAPEVASLTGVTIRTVSHISSFLTQSHKEMPGSILAPHCSITHTQAAPQSLTAWQSIYGQELAKRALTIAAAGGHNVYLLGPPGTGKSMLAEAMTSVLPPLSEAESLEVTALHSLIGSTIGTTIYNRRPFRKVHHTVSAVGLVGGGSQLLPGEISLAHRGVLFLDEFTEFPRSILETLRQPLETKSITISRATGTVQYPANFSLIAAANPCPCGFAGSQKRACTCNEYQRIAYAHRVSGPLLDRIDLVSWVGELDITAAAQQQLLSVHKTADSDLPAQILAARTRQHQRFSTVAHCSTNADMTPDLIRKYCHITPAARKLLIMYSEKKQFSLRQYFRIIKVAQTIADLGAEDQITERALAEAIQHRVEVPSTQ